jgi:hypothetical protein
VIKERDIVDAVPGFVVWGFVILIAAAVIASCNRALDRYHTQFAVLENENREFQPQSVSQDDVAGS